jgi:hypothetical protein
MADAETLRDAVVSVEVNSTYSEALVLLSDGSRLEFRHTVQERWAKAFEPEGAAAQPCQANQILATLDRFRLNAKHLDLQFTDGSRWERRFSRQPEG